MVGVHYGVGERACLCGAHAEASLPCEVPATGLYGIEWTLFRAWGRELREREREKRQAMSTWGEKREGNGKRGGRA